LLNLRAGVELGDWTVTLWVNNALDDRTPVVLTRLLDFSRPLQIPPVIPGNANQTTFYRDLQVSYPRKRAGGLTVKYAF
jgi:outer membrane receptor protein involved in Fe transport